MTGTVTRANCMYMQIYKAVDEIFLIFVVIGTYCQHVTDDLLRAFTCIMCLPSQCIVFSVSSGSDVPLAHVWNVLEALACME